MSSLTARLNPRHYSIRVRISLLSLVTVAAALAAFSVALVLIQRELLTDRIEDGLATRARDVAALIQSDQPTASINEQGEEAFIQLIGSDEAVIAASDNITDEPPFTTVRVQPGELRFVNARGRVRGDSDSFRVAVLGVASDSGQITVLAGRNLEPVTDATEVLITVLAIAIPVLTLFVGAAAWLLTGRALKPVDTMRSEVDQIGGEIAGRRIDEPHTEDEVARLARTMNRMLERVDAVQQGQKRFVADASHELRTPLTAFKAGLEANIGASGASGDDDMTRMLRASLDDVDRMELLIEELLSEAAAAEGVVAEPVQIDLDDVVLEEVSAARLGSEIEIDSSGVSGAQVLGNAGQLRRAVRNLLNNATRHAESRVALTLQEAGGGVKLTVDDDGPGIPESDHERIFERFVSLDASRSRQQAGAGIGLTITRRIVEAHEGRVYVDPEFTDGARFVVELPGA